MENNIHFIAAKGGGWVDNPFYYETLCAAKSIMWLNQPLYYYRKTNPTSSSNLQKDVTLPFVRMQDNFDMIESYHVDDIETLTCAYARALMYYTGALKDFDYDANAEEINNQAARLMQRFNEDIFIGNFNISDQQRYYSALSPLGNLKLKCPRILIYNWVPYNNQWNFGGGVTVYCRNLIQQIRRNNPEVSIYVLSSGFAYDASSLEIFTRKINSDSPDVHQYEIVNSPIPAEQANMFVNPTAAVKNERLKKVFSDFLSKYGPFDVIHFNNIEGLSLDVFDLKKDYPDTRFIYSIHNYVPMCVHGFYYMRHKHKNCTPDHTGKDCMKCTRISIRRNIADATYDRGLFNKDPKLCYSKKKWVDNFGLSILDEETDEKNILNFSRTAIEKINKYCDNILAVSKRVFEIAEDNGFDTSKMLVSYIGTKVAEHQIGHSAYEVKDKLKLVFLGNDINFEEKGYPFLLEALSELESDYASKIDIVLTVRQKEHAEIYSMLSRFGSLKVINGYTHNDIPDILRGCNLSIVPVLWEDNLPQIAIESVAYGVPVLASTAGGASELCDSKMFSFEAGNKDDLLNKIRHFVDDPNALSEYWRHHHGLVTMEEHWKQLMQIYSLHSNEVNMSIENFRNLLKENAFFTTTLQKISSQSTYDSLRFQINALESEKNDLKQQINSLQAELETEKKDMKQVFKVIFQAEHNASLGEAGADLFMIELDNFQFSDFYAEIKFVNISNIAPSYSDILKISGTMLESEDRERKITLHQMEWVNGSTPLTEEILVCIKGNRVVFWGKYNGVASGYLYQLETLTSRALYESAHFENINNGFLYGYTMKPVDAVYALSYGSDDVQDNTVSESTTESKGDNG